MADIDLERLTDAQVDYLLEHNYDLSNITTVDIKKMDLYFENKFNLETSTEEQQHEIIKQSKLEYEQMKSLENLENLETSESPEFVDTSSYILYEQDQEYQDTMKKDTEILESINSVSKSLESLKSLKSESESKDFKELPPGYSIRLRLISPELSHTFTFDSNTFYGEFLEIIKEIYPIQDNHCKIYDDKILLKSDMKATLGEIGMKDRKIYRLEF